MVVVALPTRTRNREPLCPRTLREQALSSETPDSIGTQFREIARVCLTVSLVLCYSFTLHHGTLQLRSSDPWPLHCVTHTYRHTLAGKIAAQGRLIGPHQTVAKTRLRSPLLSIFATDRCGIPALALASPTRKRYTVHPDSRASPASPLLSVVPCSAVGVNGMGCGLPPTALRMPSCDIRRGVDG